MKQIFQTLVGGIVGFFGMYFALSLDFTSDFSIFGLELTLFITGIAVLLLVFTMVTIQRVKRKAKLQLRGEEEDELDSKQYKSFSDITLGSVVAMVLSVVATAIAVITEQPIWVVVAAGATLIGAIVISIITPGLIKLIYPERDLPKPGEKDYAKKLLAVSDEGERHVMLEGLYRTHNTMNLALFIALLLLMIYSVSTGVSQLFAIFVVALILIIANVQYTFSIRNKI
ncbi:Protein of unknown function [Planococcus glaciei]|uniref:DUF3169 family protein n=1 Tax=Planococcus glaciei TaxID=459472 RepID=UPI0008815294|nr:DUF3169 family protein [Planococcus glaciei]SDG83818.1 Protein of unknown function [Planococcus glaciei]